MNEALKAELWRNTEMFYRLEVLLLQDRRYREWLQLMDADVRYEVPVTTSTVDGLATREGELGYYDEDLELLNARVAKLESKQSWVEQPPSRLRYFVQLVDLHCDSEGLVHARSNLLLFQYRWNMEQQFSGGRTDTFVVSNEQLKLRKRVVILDRQSAGNQGLSVFF